jgi:scyllo-inositol 2-dehydrogenase (NADP+)
MVSHAAIRTGLIGFGLAGRVFHEPFLATNPAFQLEVIATGNPDRQAEARGRGSYDIVDTPEQVFGRDLDLIVLASPPAAHFAQGIAALESGSAVVVDKPFAASVAQAEQLIETSGRVGKPLIVFQNRRWDGDFLTVKKLVESGRLGEVFRFESTFERYAGPARERWQDAATQAEGAGITFDLGSHLVDQALHLFGPATLERAELRVVRKGGASEDDAFLSLAHAGGVTSHITVSRMAAQSGPRFRVLGSDSAYSVHGLDNQEAALKLGARPTDAGFGVVPEAEWGYLGGETDASLVRFPTERGNYAGFYEGVAATLQDGADTPVDVQDALATLRILELAHEMSA